MQPLKEHIDFYYNEHGYMVFTAQYHLNRGNCCGNGCKHCPFDYEKVPEPKRTTLLAARQKQQEKGPSGD
ncbi:MAG TPA: DUF5522 domain-containing protein [Chitinophaga sp.]|uniref:DUF5522 domain-containing protein n=1 Tax=Chitinophaga sp. TaxID=1869181 RepID=UPI002F949035